LFNLPNILTISRILVIPAVFATVYWENNIGNVTACVLFALAAITDFFDGYLARSMNKLSKFGRFLDPIADKLLVASVLLILAYSQRLSDYGLIPAVIIMCREILVSGLREFLAEINVGMPVTKLAKWKTTFQLIALPILLLGTTGWEYFPYLGEAFLWLAAILTVITGYDYMKSGLKYMNEA